MYSLWKGKSALAREHGCCEDEWELIPPLTSPRLLAFLFAIKEFKVLSWSVAYINGTRSHLFFTNFLSVYFLPALGPTLC